MANLATTVKEFIELQAGGPGSGRKPEFGSKNRSELNRMHKSLADSRFSF